MKSFITHLYEKGVLNNKSKFKEFIDDVIDVILTDWEQHKRGVKPKVTYEVGEYFTKIVKNHKTYAFVDNETGVIHRPANDNIPKKSGGNVGNIKNKNVYHTVLTPHGLRAN